MGYEVLDADGSTSGRSASPLTPDEVVALHDLPEPADVEPDRRRRAHRRRLPNLARLPTQGGRRTMIALAAMTIVGLVVGAVWTNHHLGAVQQAASRSTVTAFATVLSVDSLPADQGHTADLAVQIFNLGSTSFDVVVSGDGVRPTRGAPMLRMVSGTPSVGPGEDATVVARMPLDCFDDAPITFTIPVRGPDGTLHELALHDNGNVQLAATSGRSLCAMATGGQGLDVELAGTLDRPRMVLTNRTDAPLRIDEGEGGWSTGAWSVTTSPDLPVLVRPGSPVSVRLTVTLKACVRDLAELSNTYIGAGYLTLRTERERVDMGLDITPLLGVAIARACG